MSAAELAEALQPLIDELQTQSGYLEDQVSRLEYLAQVQFGVIVAVGVVAGLILVYLLLRKF